MVTRRYLRKQFQTILHFLNHRISHYIICITIIYLSTVHTFIAKIFGILIQQELLPEYVI